MTSNSFKLSKLINISFVNLLLFNFNSFKLIKLLKVNGIDPINTMKRNEIVET